MSVFVSLDMVAKGWFGVFKDREKYYITPTTYSITQACDVVLGGEESDTATWSGWEVKTVNIDSSVILISCI